jgi:hypothetical protein
MKIDEVMFGDIVSLAGNPIHVTLGVFNHWSNNIKPIPLTPEILEKNGFGCDRNDGYAILKLEDNSELLYYFHEYKLTWFYKSEIIFRCQCVYVHQLQRALKLCGIDKEIII